LAAIRGASAIIVCPSNPLSSIGPILAVPGIRTALEQATVPVVAVSPIIGGSAISGPAHKLMAACGLEASAFGVAQCYQGFVKTLLIADEDRSLNGRIENLGVGVRSTEIRMPALDDKRRLAREVLALAYK
jgi:LPPG:FO 2-phospho-L-lactate transferase